VALSSTPADTQASARQSPRGAPDGVRTDVPWVSLDSETNTDGFMLASGYSLDVAAGGYVGMSFTVATYPGMKALADRDFEAFKRALCDANPDSGLLARLDAVGLGGLDADDQHDPASLPALLAALDDADLVIGSRRRGGTAMPLHRRLANAVSSRAISWCAGRAIRDAQCGFRGIHRTLLDRVPHQGGRYEAETSFVIRTARAGAIIAQVEIPTRYGPPSHFRPLRDAARVIATIWSHRPSRLPACDSSAPTTTVSSRMVSTALSAPLNR
jgi:hypothetical protein